MGYGHWDDDHYRAAETFRRRTGQADFGYDSTLRGRPRSEWRADPKLDPKDVGFRESRDSAEHPVSTPIAILFDVTGSMGTVPRIMQRELTKLHGLIRRKRYVSGPQILFGGIGDADCDRVPLQVGQFESDNRMDEQLRTIFLEGGGGGQKSESYELAAYFMARHTRTDAWEKRGRKGYLFVIGDELNKPRLKASHVRNIIGDDVREDMGSTDIWREVQRRWETFFILPKQTGYFNDPEINRHWRGLLGERFLRLEEPTAVCDLIAVTVGVMEEAVTLREGLNDLTEAGSTNGLVVGKALATVPPSTPDVPRTASRAVARFAAVPDDLDSSDDLM